MHSKPVWIYKFSKVYSKYIYFRFQAERKRAEFFLLSNDEAKRNRLLYLKIMSKQVTKYICTLFVDFANNLYAHLVILIYADICTFFWTFWMQIVGFLKYWYRLIFCTFFWTFCIKIIGILKYWFRLIFLKRLTRQLNATPFVEKCYQLI